MIEKEVSSQCQGNQGGCRRPGSMFDVDLHTEDRGSVPACLLSMICRIGEGGRRGYNRLNPPKLKCTEYDRNMPDCSALISQEK